MNLRRGATALALGCAVSLTLVACGGSGESEPSSSAAPSKSAAPIAVMPSLVELNDVMARFLDPNLPVDQRALTIEDGEKAGDFFDIVSPAAAEQNIRLEAVDPVMPGFTSSAVVVGINLIREGEQADGEAEGEAPEPQRIEGVDFINKNGRWMLSKDWACQLAASIKPDQKPAFCLAPGETPSSSPSETSSEESAPAETPAPEESPAPEPAPEGPVEQPAPAPVEQPAPAPEAAPAPAPEAAPAAAPEAAPAP